MTIMLVGLLDDLLLEVVSVNYRELGVNWNSLLGEVGCLLGKLLLLGECVLVCTSFELLGKPFLLHFSFLLLLHALASLLNLIFSLFLCFFDFGLFATLFVIFSLVYLAL